MLKEFEQFENEKKQSLIDLVYSKQRLISQINKNRELIRNKKGNYKYIKRLFFIRWYEIFREKLKMAYYRLILLLFNKR